MDVRTFKSANGNVYLATKFPQKNGDYKITLRKMLANGNLSSPLITKELVTKESRPNVKGLPLTSQYIIRTTEDSYSKIPHHKPNVTNAYDFIIKSRYAPNATKKTFSGSGKEIPYEIFNLSGNIHVDGSIYQLTQMDMPKGALGNEFKFKNLDKHSPQVRRFLRKIGEMLKKLK